MNLKNVEEAKEWFEVLQTSEKCQTAVMTLKAGGASGAAQNSHEKSEQVLLVLEGEVEAEVAGEKRTLRPGDVVVIPAGVPHRFSNRGESSAITSMPTRRRNIRPRAKLRERPKARPTAKIVGRALRLPRSETGQPKRPPYKERLTNQAASSGVSSGVGVPLNFG